MNTLTKRITRSCGVVLALALALALAPREAQARLVVRITDGVAQPLALAAPAFEAATPDLAGLATTLRQVMLANLTRAGLFRALDPASFLVGAKVGETPRFADWRPLGADGLVAGRLSRGEGGVLRLDIALWDVFASRQALTQGWLASPEESRRLAHSGANAVYTRLTGEAGPFDAQIAFVAESGPKKNRIKRLAIMDQDGYGLRHLTDGDHLVVTPRFDPTGARILYMSFESRTPQVYLYDLATGRRARLGSFPGMTYAPRFSPDGRDVVMSLESQGESNIYRYSLTSRDIQPLTEASAIDTGASYAPDGRRITFESDRDGRQQLYIINTDGSGIQRISYGDGVYATPVWSPRGDYIAFTKLRHGRFLIGVMRPDGSGERILTAGFHNEGPSWSPNGRSLLFFRETPGKYGGPHLWSVDITGHNERPVITPTFASDPTWSPAKSVLQAAPPIQK